MCKGVKITRASERIPQAEIFGDITAEHKFSMKGTNLDCNRYTQWFECSNATDKRSHVEEQDCTEHDEAQQYAEKMGTSMFHWETESVIIEQGDEKDRITPRTRSSSSSYQWRTGI